MHGTVMGGGLEIALACHYRVAAPARDSRARSDARHHSGCRRNPADAAAHRRGAGAGVILSAQTGRRAQGAMRWASSTQMIEGDLRAGAIDYARSLIAAARGRGAPARCSVDRGNRHGRDLRALTAAGAQAVSESQRRPDRHRSRPQGDAVLLRGRPGVRNRRWSTRASRRSSRAVRCTCSSPNAKPAECPGLRDGCAAAADQVGRRHRCGHDGRRHCDLFRQCRHPRDDAGRERSALERGLANVDAHLSIHGEARPPHGGGQGAAHGADPQARSTTAICATLT